MKLISLEEAEEKIQKFIDARKDKKCQKSALTEKKAFEYALAVIRKCKVYDQDI